ncbi:NADP-dependent oxidoreductase domain-containing protein [Aspergillus karnatakaensis]|uniref:aldo/keto reductase family protein n=1 Tax=Aspergillus karnatakaensis TaxID=1810916 RepID=UPI003CCCD096
MASPIEMVFGSGGWKTITEFGGIEQMKQAITFLQREGIQFIDTSALYGDSEVILGQVGAPETHTIDTKHPGGAAPGITTTEEVLKVANESLKRLGTDKVNVYYFHSPERRASLEPGLEAINTLYNEGKIAQFGLSNFLPDEVGEVLRITKENNWLRPTVYQGSYAAISRRPEVELFPLLRENGISFHAYSPIAGGFLAKDVDELFKDGGENATGRWDKKSFVGEIYHLLYNKPSMIEGLRLWKKIAKEAGVSGAELAYRWVVHNSALRGELGDRVIVGAKNLGQLKETISWVKKGALDESTAKQIEDVWKLVEKASTLDPYNDGVLKISGALEKRKADWEKAR